MKHISERMAGVRHKVTSVFMAGVLAVGMMPLPAYANGITAGQADLTPQQSYSAAEYVIGEAYAAAEPAPEILGLTNPLERTSSKAEDMKLAIFGTSINKAPNPYFANTYQALNKTDTAASPTLIAENRQASPESARPAYTGTGSQSDMAWEALPAVIFGTGGLDHPSNEETFYDDDPQYARAVEKNLGLSANSYHPKSVTYDRTNLNTMVSTMYKAAKLADVAAAADNTKSLRYGSATDIAKQYESYVIGTKAYVLNQLNAGTVKDSSGNVVKMRTVANVQSYDESAKTFTIIDYGVAEGTATGNRLLEAVQGCVYNYYDTAGATVTVDQLKNNVDVIIYGGQASSGNVIDALSENGLLSKTFYAEKMDSGSIFGVTVNSVENAQNVGRILSCVYPEMLSQSDMMAYYYETFYHLNTGDVKGAIAKYMDGVRNWKQTTENDYLKWEVSDVEDDYVTRVNEKLNAGMSYAIANKDQLPTYAQPSTESTIENAVSGLTLDIQPTTYEYSGSAITPAFTVKETSTGNAVLVVDNTGTASTGADAYDFVYSNNTNVGTGSITVTPKSGDAIGGLNGTFTITKKETTDALTATVAESATYTLNSDGARAGVSNVQVGSKTLSPDEYTLTYENNEHATYDASGNSEASAKVTITAKNYTREDGTALTKEYSFKVVPFNITGKTSELMHWEMSDVSSQRYTGEEIKPTVTVQYQNGTNQRGATYANLTENKDYTVTYANNTNTGEATLTVTPTAKTNFTGSIVKKFTIYKVEEDGDEAAKKAVEGGFDDLDVTLTGDATSLKLSVADKTGSASSDAQQQKVDGVDSENFKVFDVSLASVKSDGTTVKQLTGESGVTFGKISLTFDLEADNAGKLATVKQIHNNGTANEVIDHGSQTVNSEGKITVSNIDKLSEFAISMETQYTVKFNSAGGSAVADQTVVAGGQIATSPTTKRTNYTFAGWYDGNTKVNFPYTVNGDVELTAHWNVASSVMYRLYNPYSGEHLYTSDASERDKVAAAGWNYEGTAWNAPSTGDPVYRLYNSHEPLGDHHYTTSKSEYDQLVSIGWTGEGVGWYSDPNKGVGLHRLYNPNAYPSGKTGAHHYTTSDSEKNNLVSLGWQYENYGWYGVK